MTEADFRRNALGMRTRSKARTWGIPTSASVAGLCDAASGSVVGHLPDQQQTFVRQNPATFKPEGGCLGPGLRAVATAT
jgi:hypothetical protein